MSEIKAVIYDLDGTLAQTRVHYIASMGELLRNHDIAAEDAKILGVYGLKMAEIFLELAPEHTFDYLLDSLVEIQDRDDMQDMIELYEGVQDTLRYIARLGLKQAMLTNRMAFSALPMIEKLGIADYLHPKITVDTVRAKPHPEGIYQICDELELKPSEVIMVGDTPADVQAATAAKTGWIIGVDHHGDSFNLLWDSGAHSVVSDFSEVKEVVARMPFRTLQ